MTAGQLLLTLLVLALVALSLVLLGVVRRQSRALDAVHRSIERLADQTAQAQSRSEPAVPLEPLPESARPESRTGQPSLVTALFGAPLVRLAALTFGLRQALGADHRRHISRVVDAELRAARRRRRTATLGVRRSSVRTR